MMLGFKSWTLFLFDAFQGPHVQCAKGERQHVQRPFFLAVGGGWLSQCRRRRVANLRATVSEVGHGIPDLEHVDPEIGSLINKERMRQSRSVNLIASENYASPFVFEILGSVLNNKYSEGLPGARYYGGNFVIDDLEKLCKDRALKAFNLSPELWSVNVQPYSGSPANFAVYTALLEPHDRIMGMSLMAGGHLTHGHYTTTRKVSATSIYFESLPYGVDPKTGLIDYEALRETAKVFRPRLIIAGASAYPRHIDWAQFRAACDEVGAYLLVDMAHISGLDPPDLVRESQRQLPSSESIQLKLAAVFPALQGGPHNATIGALAFQLREVASPEFKDYCERVVANSKVLASCLTKHGSKLVTGGTDNHLLLWDLKAEGLSGAKMEKVCEEASIIVNRNTIASDSSPISPGGVRLGSCAMTTRRVDEEGFRRIGTYLVRARDIARGIQERPSRPGKSVERWTWLHW
ncbi:Serine hydroxymethyltransferase 5 (AtSHMT5) (Glycine hydroxymethyltransferase 5) (Protein EMBRYO SAC DEVELOPMENT ARREST 36) (Protein EMBRYO SAC DEVELOPMENT ARREST 37) (Serine methylase 5) [Durusdinium trenchii]|uniref:glycine hydroxymethyltransferase n=1 Tax=Durusdinium trenchii TaxID=1381693 RepID=A0ABP0QS43_9DINO